MYIVLSNIFSIKEEEKILFFAESGERLSSVPKNGQFKEVFTTKVGHIID